MILHVNHLLADDSHEISKIESEHDQEIPQSQTADKPKHKPYLLFLKKQQNLKMSSATNYR